MPTQNPPDQSWRLIDTENGINETDFHVAAESTAGAQSGWSISQRVLRGGLSEGVTLTEIDNGTMRLMVLPTRGMGIWRAERPTSGGTEMLGWRSPVRGPVHPSFVPLHDPSGLGWLEGFDELIVRCGLENNGAPEFDDEGTLKYPLHGRIANRPAHYVDVAVDESARTITLRGIVEETRFHFQKLRLETVLTTSFDSTTFTIRDRVVNFGGTPAEMQMLYHINIGEPHLQAGASLVTRTESVRKRGSETPGEVSGWETYGPPVAGASEECYYTTLLGDDEGQTQLLLKNAEGDGGIGLRYNPQQLPCFTLWKNLVASEDGYVTGLEPATNFPECRSQEVAAGRVVALEPGESWSAEFAVDWLVSAEQVAMAEEKIGRLAK